MYDDLQCNLPVPDGQLPPGSWFQTKTLNCGMDRFTITAQGRLIFHKRRFEAVGERAIVAGGVVIPQQKVAHVEDIDMDYHGDIRIVGSATDGSLAEYVVRFTHGAVEWIRPYATLSDTHKSWFYSKS
jgi:hypothetical protein